jgi:hypothetical protein
MVPPGRLVGSSGKVVRLAGEDVVVVGMKVGRASRGDVSDAEVGAASRSRVSTSIFCVLFFCSLLFFWSFLGVGSKDKRRRLQAWKGGSGWVG